MTKMLILNLVRIPQLTVRNLAEGTSLFKHILEGVERRIFINSLRERISLYHKGANRSQGLPKIGDIVLVKDDNLPRAAWKLGKIINLVQGQDGMV